MSRAAKHASPQAMAESHSCVRLRKTGKGKGARDGKGNLPTLPSPCPTETCFHRSETRHIQVTIRTSISAAYCVSVLWHRWC